MLDLVYPTKILEELPRTPLIFWRYAGWLFAEKWFAQGYSNKASPMPEAYGDWAWSSIISSQPVNFTGLRQGDGDEEYVTILDTYRKRKLFVPRKLSPLLYHHEQSTFLLVRFALPPPSRKLIEGIGVFATIRAAKEHSQEHDSQSTSYRLRAIVLPEINTPIY